jgi:hypothetical protein
MLTVVAVPAVDTGPELLRISADVPRIQPVAAHRLEAGGRRVELCILAASHQVVVEEGDGRHAEHVEHVETVACGLPAGTGRRLSDGATYDHGRWRVTAAVERLDAGAFRHQAAVWRRRGRTEGDSIVVQFPNHPDALTALAWMGEGWVAAHLYPDGVAGGGVVVLTTTSPVPVGVVAPVPAGPEPAGPEPAGSEPMPLVAGEPVRPR